MFGRKHDFKPDKTHSGTLNKLYLTKKQRLAIGKWTLVSLLLRPPSPLRLRRLKRLPLPPLNNQRP